MQKRVTEPQVVVLGLDAQAGLPNQAQQVVGAVHSADAVCQAGEVQRRGVEAVRGRIVLLAIAEELEHEYRSTGLYPARGNLQHTDRLLFRETVEKLTHPDRIGARGQSLTGVEQIRSVIRDPVAVCRALDSFPCPRDLLG